MTLCEKCDFNTEMVKILYTFSPDIDEVLVCPECGNVVMTLRKPAVDFAEEVRRARDNLERAMFAYEESLKRWEEANGRS